MNSISSFFGYKLREFMWPNLIFSCRLWLSDHFPARLSLLWLLEQYFMCLFTTCDKYTSYGHDSAYFLLPIPSDMLYDSCSYHMHQYLKFICISPFCYGPYFFPSHNIVRFKSDCAAFLLYCERSELAALAPKQKSKSSQIWIGLVIIVQSKALKRP